MKVKILFWVALLNIIGVVFIYILSFMTNNNHYAVSIDTFFISTSALILIITLILKQKIAILVSIMALLLSISMNLFNISISYQNWLEREQPELGHRNSDLNSEKI
ncbi:hypothetical protein KTJ32_10070 [Acinetobacter gyllenbergii]|uniref:hypothetical protein n=1 Tax=Acinetobacter TaxID=469 RepID=UPI0008068ECE|nr:hypothetical protein [Acinetobacter gyllenbergii]MCU4581329.1 hypothetical protein [Acinetobacter gyllenbergii]OBY73917.1 hypothetical protein NG55_12100 [Acinetobacter gyllenbergii]